MQSKAERGSSSSLVVGGGAGEKDGAARGSSPSMVVSGEVGEEDSVVIMMDAAPLDTVRGTVTSTHREQEKHIRWGNRVSEASKMGLEQIARDKQKGFRTGLARNELHGNEVVQVEVGKKLGPVIREIEVLSPIKPKEKEDTSEERNRQQQGPTRMVKQAARGRIKKIAKEKGKAQVVEKFGQAPEVSKKKKR